MSTGQDYRLQNGNYVETRNSQRPYKEEAEFTSLRDQLAKTQRENAKLRSSIDQYEEKKSHDLQIIDRLADQNEKLKEDKQYLLNRSETFHFSRILKSVSFRKIDFSASALRNQILSETMVPIFFSVLRTLSGTIYSVFFSGMI